MKLLEPCSNCKKLLHIHINTHNIITTSAASNEDIGFYFGEQKILTDFCLLLLFSILCHQHETSMHYFMLSI